MVKNSLKAGGVVTTFDADIAPAEAKIARLKQTVKQAAGEMQQAAGNITPGLRGTSTGSVSNPQDLGSSAADSLRPGNVQDKLEKLKKRDRDQRERDITANLAFRAYQEETGRPYRDRAQIQFEREMASQRAGEANARSSAVTNAAYLVGAGRTASMMQRVGGALSAMGITPGVALAGGAIVAGGAAALYGAGREIGSGFAARHAFEDASTRYSFQGRTAYNDPTLRSAAGAQADLARGGGVFGSIISRLPIAGELFAEKLERAARSADRIASSYQQAIGSRQGSEIALARSTGRPLDALAKEQDIAMQTAQGKVTDAERELLKIRTEPGWGTSDKWEARITAARKTRDATILSKIELEKAQQAERERATAVFNAERYGITTSERSANWRGAELVAQRRGSGLQAFAAQRMQKQLEMDQSFENRLAAVKGDATATAQIENERIQARMNFGVETQLGARQLSLGRTGRAGSVSEAGLFGRLNRERYSGEQQNFKAMADDAMRQLSAALKDNTDALRSQGAWEDN